MKTKLSVSRCCCVANAQCECEFSSLYISLNAGITVTLIDSYVDGTLITHTVRLTCDADAEFLDIVLDPLSCTGISCETLDMTGQFVGLCEIGVILFGNSETCINACVGSRFWDCTLIDTGGAFEEAFRDCGWILRVPAIDGGAPFGSDGDFAFFHSNVANPTGPCNPGIGMRFGAKLDEYTSLTVSGKISCPAVSSYPPNVGSIIIQPETRLGYSSNATGIAYWGETTGQPTTNNDLYLLGFAAEGTAWPVVGDEADVSVVMTWGLMINPLTPNFREFTFNYYHDALLIGTASQIFDMGCSTEAFWEFNRGNPVGSTSSILDLTIAWA